MTAAAVVAGALFGATLLLSNAAFARETVQETQPRLFGPFNFLDHGALLFQERRCIAAQELPDYPLAAVSVGQYTSEGALWVETFELRR